MREIGAIFFGLASALLACEKLGPPPEPPFVEIEADAALYERTPCGLACRHLRILRCPEGWPRFDGGMWCEQLCTEAIADGLLPVEYPGCVQSAQTTDEFRSCGVRCGTRP